MKILIVVPYFDEPHRWMISGQKTAYHLAKKHDVVVVTTGQTAAIEQPNPRLKIYRLKDIFLPDPINYSIVPGLMSHVRRIVIGEAPDAFVINKHMFFTSFAIWPLKKMGKPVIVQTDTFPGINWFPRHKAVAAVMWLYARLIGNRILRAADKVILLHEGLAQDAEALGLNYEVVHNGIDLEAFDAAPKPNDMVKKKGEVWIGYVGRLESVKGWDDLAAVAMDIVAQYHHIRFFFIGPTKNCEAQIALYRHPSIHFLGARNDIAGFDRLLDIFVMPSLSEGLSNAVMEAMAARCCCLVSDVGGNVILIEDGVTGRTFQRGSRTNLKAKLEELLANRSEIKKLGVKARERIEADYDLVKNIDKVAAIVRS